MKIAIALVVLVVVLGVVVFGRRRRSQSPSGVLQLRAMALTASPTEFGIQTEHGEAWGVVMDTAYPEASASLLSLSDGSASLYFSTGGAVIGGQAHDKVASAAKAFVREASKRSSSFTRAADLSLPPLGRTRFYVRTADSTLTAEASEAELGGGKHALSPLFYAGQEVITQLRIISEQHQ